MNIIVIVIVIVIFFLIFIYIQFNEKISQISSQISSLFILKNKEKYHEVIEINEDSEKLQIKDKELNVIKINIESEKEIFDKNYIINKVQLKNLNKEIKKGTIIYFPKGFMWKDKLPVVLVKNNKKYFIPEDLMIFNSESSIDIEDNINEKFLEQEIFLLSIK